MEQTCHVCGQPLDDLYAVRCVVCGRSIHFQAADSAEIGCSRVVTEIGHCGLAFVCAPCSSRVADQERPPA